MRIAQWMKGPVHGIGSHETVRRAVALLRQLRVNQLPVIDNGKLVGIVTERDLRAALPPVPELPESPADREGMPDPDHVRVETVMTANVLTLGPDDTVEQAARLMRRRRIGAIPIVENGRVVGMLTRSDVIDALLAQADRQAAS